MLEDRVVSSQDLYVDRKRRVLCFSFFVTTVLVLGVHRSFFKSNNRQSRSVFHVNSEGGEDKKGENSKGLIAKSRAGDHCPSSNSLVSP